jgi:lysyl-tRNA synthetase class 2
MTGEDWRPTAALETLRRRAELLRRIRDFFAERDVLEVETPALGAATVTDLHLHSFSTRLAGAETEPRTLFLQTSPEFAMKRLLAAGSGPIYQLCHVFRDGEQGRRHNPEFTLLEWYRPGFDHHELMDEVEELLRELLTVDETERLTYSELFQRHLAFEPLRTATPDLVALARETGAETLDDDDRDGALHFLLSTRVEPELPAGTLTFVHAFPASQAALARVVDDGGEASIPVAERFEVYLGSTELANGFHELTDATEQRHRFESDLEARRRLALPEPPIDERLLAALEHGLPSCAGVAVGFDRLVMLATGAESIDEVLAFPSDRA